MNQSTIIFGYLAVAFLVFITQRGELPIYWGFLVSSPKQPAAGPSVTKEGALVNSNDKLAQMNKQNLDQFSNAVGAFAKVAALV